MSKIEILSPCGGFDSVVAAVRSGADAIYVGAKDFSARASAKNFSIKELSDTVKYCHRSGVLVYLALNTLVFDDEMDDALSLVKEAAKCDIDAVITQDIGLAMAIKKAVPTLKLHASTQMSVHSLKGAQALKELGFSRVVLAREMTKDEIKYIADNCDIELEVFVHGALCMCVSGQCYMSAALGGRSANRGMCAQPCRLPFSSDSSNTHALSLKDNSIIDYISELEAIGVTSAKIEGRMKRPEYVASATLACVMMRDKGYIDDTTRRHLASVFSRTGFTDGYYNDKRGYNMFGYRKREDVVSASEKLLREIRTTYKDELNRVDIDFDIDITEGGYIMLSVTDGSNFTSVKSENIVEKSINSPATVERIQTLLQKTGDTPYRLNALRCDIKGDCFVSAKEINSLRRQVLESLSKKREIINNHTVCEVTFDDLTCGNVQKTTGKKQTYAVVPDLNIPLSFADFEYVFVSLFEAKNNKDTLTQLKNSGINIAVEIPRALFNREEKVIEALREMQDFGITDVLCHNIAAAYISKELGFVFHLSFAMNIANSLSLKFAKEYGAKDVEISFELDYSRINALKSYVPFGVYGYGHIPLMMTRNCPVKSGTHTCATCKNRLKLQDRKGEKFLLKCDKNVTEILNCVPLKLPEEVKKLQNPQFTVFHFSVENSVENKEKVLEKLSEKQKFERFTHGLYLRGVKNFTIS